MEEKTAQGQTAAQAPEKKKFSFTEAPYSGNVRARIRSYDWQLTIRDDDKASFIERVMGVNKWLDSMKAQPATNGEHAPQPVAQTPPTPPVQAQPVSPSQPTKPYEAQCQMIEVGTSYTGNKTQLKFHCIGLDNPLTYTKSPQDMANLLAPLGFTLAHIQIGQKYPKPCIVTYSPHTDPVKNKTYNNVMSVRPAMQKRDDTDIPY